MNGGYLIINPGINLNNLNVDESQQIGTKCYEQLKGILTTGKPLFVITEAPFSCVNAKIRLYTSEYIRVSVPVANGAFRLIDFKPDGTITRIAN